MSSVVPVISPSADPLQALATAVIGFIVGKYIESAGAVANQLARAQSLLKIASALIEVNSGNTTQGVTDLQTAVSNLVATVKDPAGALALNELLAVADTQIGILANTFIGKLQGLTANLIVTQIAAVAQYYVQSLTPTAAAAAKK
jgi:hypothetical protein